MVVISCLSQKGGVGKSTLCRMLATAYAGAGWSVKIADFNLKQKTSTDWAAMRMEAGLEPTVQAEAFGAVAVALRQAGQFDLMVMDGRPDSDVTTLDIARRSDLIIVPVGVSMDDLAPQVRFAHELISKGIVKRRILFVINRSIESLIALTDARAYVTQAGYTVCDTDLPMKTGYQMAQNAGRSILETTYPSLNERSGRLAEEIDGALQSMSKTKASA